jgi:benzoate-CoA ligase family protein
MNLVDFVFRAVREQSLWPRTALYYKDSAISYETLFGMVKRCAGMLRAAGLGPGDRVAVVATDSPEFVVSFLGAAAIRCVAVPLSTRLSTDNLIYVLRQSGARAVISSLDQVERLGDLRVAALDVDHVWLIEGESPGTASFADALAGAEETGIVPASDDDLAFILYTSGSTGAPKGVMHLHRALPFTVEAGCRQVLKVQPEDRLFSSSKLFFAYGLGNSLSFPLSSGASSILVGEKPTADVIAAALTKYKPTIFFGVPSVFRALCQWLAEGKQLETGSLKFCMSGGEKLPEALFYEWRDLTGLDILDGIGSTEMLQMFISNRRGQVVPGTCGRPVPGYEAKLLDPGDDEIAGPGTGELLIKGGSASPGYWMDPENTALTMQGEWIRTGDVFQRTADGVYRYTGRADDLFKVKGQWVSPVEVEEAILACEQVLEAAVVCGPDRDGMNAAIAFVVVQPGLRADQAAAERLRATAGERLPAFKCPVEVRFLDQLPRTETGKLQRFKLRDSDYLAGTAIRA